MKCLWPKELIAEFSKFVGKPNANGCRLWLGDKNKKGYGIFKYDGKWYNPHRLALAIRDNIPIPPKHIHACHNCPGKDNPSCVCTDHLFWGTYKEHGADKRAKAQYRTGKLHPRHLHPEKFEHLKGSHPELKISRVRGDKHWTKIYPEKLKRGAEHIWYGKGCPRPGEANGAASLTNKQVLQILELKLENYGSNFVIAEVVGTTRNTVQRIITGESWKHISVPFLKEHGLL